MNIFTTRLDSVKQRPVFSGKCKEIERTRLLDSIVPAILPGNVLVITGRPGSGKTYFGHQLLERWDGKGAYIDLKESGSDINDLIKRFEKLFTHLWNDSCCATEIERRRQKNRENSPLSKMDCLLDRFFLCGGSRAVIVLDGVEAANARPLWSQFLHKLIERCPSFLAFVLLSSQPIKVLPMNSLRMGGNLLELTEKELFFDQKETQHFLELNVPGITLETVNKIFHKVGGWPAGLSLVCLEMRKQGVRTFVSDQLMTSLHNFLQYEVLAGIAPGEMKILCAASLLEPFNTDILFRVLGKSHQQLSSFFLSFEYLLEQQTGAASTRFTQIFSHHLVNRSQEILGKDGIRHLHKKAARYFKKQHDLARCLDHLSALEEWDSVIRILLTNRKFSTLEEYERLVLRVENIPAQFVRNNPGVSILAGKAYLYLGELEKAWQSFSYAHNAARPSSSDWLESGCRLCEVILLRGELDKGVDLAAVLVSRSIFISRYRAEALMFQAIGLHLLCRLEECDRLWQHISTIASSRFLPLDQASRCYLMAPKAIFYNLERGEFEESERILDLAITVFRQRDPRKRLGWILLFKGVLKLEIQQKREAISWFREAVEISKQTNRSVYAACAAFLSFVLADLGEIDEAREWHERAYPVVSKDLTLWAPVLCALARSKIADDTGIAQKELHLAWNLANQKKMLLPICLVGLTAFSLRHSTIHPEIASRVCLHGAAVCCRSHVHHREALLLLCLCQLDAEAGRKINREQMQKAMEIICRKNLGFLLVRNPTFKDQDVILTALYKNIEVDYCLTLCASQGRPGLARLKNIFYSVSQQLKIKIGETWVQYGYRPALPFMQTFGKQVKQKNVRLKVEKMIRQLEKLSPDPLQINMLGAFSVSRADEPIADENWKRSKARELFKLFCLYPDKTFAREYLMELFWPSNTEQKARSNLWAVISALKSALEPELSAREKSNYLESRENSYRLSLPAGSFIDVLLFEEKAKLGIQYSEQHDNARALIYCGKAEELYRGDLLPGDLYTSWSEEPRERLRMLFTRVLRIMAEIYFNQRELSKCIELCQRIIRIDLWDEGSYLILMQCHILQGNDLMAVRVFRNCEKVLKEELNVEPNKHLQALLERILHRRTRRTF